MSSRHSEVSATEKGDATSRYTINHEESKIAKENESSRSIDKISNKGLTKTDLKSEAELPEPDVDDDILEIIQHIKNNRDKIRRVVGGDKLLIEDLIMFKDKLDDFTGVEMDSFVEYISTSHIKSKDKFSLTWSELWKIMVFDWPIWENQNRNSGKVDDWMDHDDGFDDQEIFDYIDEAQIEKEHIREKGKYLLKLKLDKHLEKISDIFRAYCENIPKSESDSESDSKNQNVTDKSRILTRTELNTTKREEEKTERDNQSDQDDKTEKDDKTERDDRTERDDKTEKDDKTDKDDKTEKGDTTSKTVKTTERKTDTVKDSMITFHKNMDNDPMMMVPQIKVKMISKVMKDLGYLINLGFTTFENFQTGNYDKKKTDKKIVEDLQKYCWKRLHIEE
jgi:hypothetical protein